MRRIRVVLLLAHLSFPRAQSGSFLVRESERAANLYFLCVNDGGEAVSFRIEPKDGGLMFANQQFKDLDEVRMGRAVRVPAAFRRHLACSTARAHAWLGGRVLTERLATRPRPGSACAGD